MREEEFPELVKESWREALVRGGNLVEKLRACSRQIMNWNKTRFGNVQKRIKEIKMELEHVQQMERTVHVENMEAKLCTELDEWLAREELMWRQRSRADWLHSGDRNTTIFHARASQRKKKNNISKLEGDDGEEITEQSAISNNICKLLQEIVQS